MEDEKLGLNTEEPSMICLGCECADGRGSLCGKNVNTHSAPAQRWREELPPAPDPSEGAYKSYWTPPSPGNDRGVFDIMPDWDPRGKRVGRIVGSDWRDSEHPAEDVGYFMELTYPWTIVGNEAKIVLPRGIASATRQIWVAWDDKPFDTCPNDITKCRTQGGGITKVKNLDTYDHEQCGQLSCENDP